MSGIGQAIIDWLDTPINKHGTPYVGHPMDFSQDEQDEFIRLVDKDRFVSREEQIEKLKEIIARRDA